MAVSTPTANPLRQGLRKARNAQPVCLVIFGGSGDLARRKLMPSLYQLQARGQMPDDYAIIGFAHTPRTDDEYRAHIKEALDEYVPGGTDDKVWQQMAPRMRYIDADLDDDAGYTELRQLVEKLNGEMNLDGNVIYYLSIPPSFDLEVVQHLDKAGLARGNDKLPGWKRIVIEKPFGHDLRSARELNQQLGEVLDESSIYRVDHYLGKETVQNILVFRFANAIFEPVWNRRYIDHVEITTAESIGLEGRGDYYEGAGALRDMVQSHCMQMTAMVGMEPPVSFGADDIRDEKVKLLRAIRRIPPTEVDQYVARGQYGPGIVDGQPVPGYRQEEGVAPNSNTETFVALKLLIDNWRWQDVPFYIRTGKRLAKKKTEITITFRQVPHGFFGPAASIRPTPNTLVMRIQPDEGISLNIETKSPGSAEIPRPVELDFRYLQSFGVTPGEAYERLLLDCMVGDQTLFARRDAVEEEWSVVTPILQGWQVMPPPDFPNYAAGSFGPTAALELLERDGRRWRRL